MSPKENATVAHVPGTSIAGWPGVLEATQFRAKHENFAVFEARGGLANGRVKFYVDAKETPVV